MANECGRLDAVLVAIGAAGGRDKAKTLIADGHVRVNGAVVRKAAFAVGPADEVTVEAAARERYVGRGGYKLEKALTLLPLPLSGCTAMDVGASTGGFTDCLLQNGAARVYAVDVGHGQLHPALRENPAVVNLEGTDIRRTEALAPLLGQNPPTVCGIDVSFISLRQVLPPVLTLMPAGGTLICLIKPQFEAGRGAIGKRGVVRDPRVHETVLADCCAAFRGLGCRLLALDFSPIRGGEGNIEYLAVLRFPADGADIETALPALVRRAFAEL